MTWKRATLADLMQDNIVYRNLEPADARIPGLRQSWHLFGMDHYCVPRKTTREYATALVGFLRQAQALRGVRAPLARLLFIGDTLMNDGTAARNLGASAPMLGFIGADRLKEIPKVEVQNDLMVANRWTALADYLAWVQASGFPCNEGTALLIDLDKTSLGPRGRNDKVIDAARVRAMERTLRDALGGRFDEAAFRTVYDPLNQPEYHYFTADNQDYLAYMALMSTAGIVGADELWAALKGGAMRTVEQFASLCEARRERMGPALRAAHDEVRRGIAAEDPTPFKAFRRAEYQETVASMDVLPDDAAEADVLAREIVITAEVASVAVRLAAQGVLVFGISDKPDEASLPAPADAARGAQPIHRARMKVQGATIA
ncbi:MAG: hypothetical protein V1772_06390 [Chloroflexota bacterium]